VTLFRRSPHLVSYWSDKELTFQNYATHTHVLARPETCHILDFFDDWRSLDDLCERWPQLDRGALQKTVGLLAEASLLQQSDRAATDAERALDGWGRWNPAAGFFHFSTKDHEYTPDLAHAERLLRRQARTVPMPPAVKRYTSARTVSLPPPRTDGEFPRVLLARRTWRQFSPRPLDLNSLATLLGLTWGVQRWVAVRGQGRVALKTSPSGGARHPIEVYVLARRVAGLARGLYHYASDAHALELLAAGGRSRQLASFLPRQNWYGSANALMLMTAVLPRVQWRYKFARAYRVVLLDAGHICQTFCLVATWLGLAPFCTAALADSHIEKALGIDGVTETVVYAAGVGTRPAGVEWAPSPSRRRTSRSAGASASPSSHQRKTSR